MCYKQFFFLTYVTLFFSQLCPCMLSTQIILLHFFRKLFYFVIYTIKIQFFRGFDPTPSPLNFSNPYLFSLGAFLCTSNVLWPYFTKRCVIVTGGKWQSPWLAKFFYMIFVLKVLLQESQCSFYTNNTIQTVCCFLQGFSWLVGMCGFQKYPLPH